MTFPRTKHHPYRPNASRDDLISTYDEIDEALRGSLYVLVTEKVDGANVGISWRFGAFQVAHRNNVATGAEFAPLWGYLWANKDALLRLMDGGKRTIYGEWLHAVHTVRYNSLPQPLLLYDAWDGQRWLPKRKFLRQVRENGLAHPAILWERDDVREMARFPKAEYLESEYLAPGLRSMYSADPMEGLYISGETMDEVVLRLKMVRADFIRPDAAHWSQRPMENQGVKL